SQEILGGEILVGDRNIASIPNSELGKLIGIVLTDRVESPNMTVYELVTLGRAPYSNFWGHLSGEDKRVVNEAIDCIGIRNLSHRKVSSLSDGERQKVMIAKTLAQQTPVILLDEPTAFLDYPSRIELMILMRKLARENNKTILLSSHDIPLAMQLSDYLWLVNDERKLVTGTPEELGLCGEIGKSFDRDGVKYDYATQTFRMD
ncbi:MAG: ABC transporter ATP-binding protein, partial [Muribaculaceae bacterium]|nr:ABC transporter ATP-binding protein [Muribaculaceae bacterium]